MTTEPQQIHTLLPAIMADIGAIEKGKKNREQNYKFRGVEDVLNRLHPVLRKHGVSLGQTILGHTVESRWEDKAGGRGQRSVTRATVKLRITFFAPDGSWRDCEGCGEGLDFGSDKATAKACSMAYKYAILLGLAIPVEDHTLDDPDQDTPADETGTKPEAQSTQAPSTKPQAPGSYSESLGAAITDDQKTRVKRLVLSLNGDDREKAKVWLNGVLAKHGKDSLDDLTVDQALKLIAKLEQMNTEKQAAALL